MNFLTLFFLLVFAHMLADYPLQGPFLAEAKNRNTKIGMEFWPHALAAHSIIHAGAVLLLTGSIVLALVEALIHAYTDFLKCEQRISLNIDQAVHIGCKAVWAGLVVWGLA